MNDAIETCRDLYNQFVFESRLAFKEGYRLKFDEMQRIIPELISDKTVYSKVAQVVLWQFYTNLRSLAALRKKRSTGSLRYKQKEKYNSINYNQSGFKLLDGKLLQLSKIGKIRINLHELVRGKIKEIRIKREQGKWYACIVTEFDYNSSCSLIRKKPIGIDVGIINFAYDSDNKIVKHPHILINSERKLKKAQRTLSKKIRGSSNRLKQKLYLNKIHKKIVNQRNDFLHKLSYYYVNNYDSIFVEDLSIQSMQKNHCLAKSISDSAWNSFFQKLEYKAERAGILFLKIPPAGTSQRCSRCNNLVKKTLAIRTHRCPHCDLIVDRDYNAAINIKQKGLDSLPTGCRKVTPVEIFPLPAEQINWHERLLKQEAHTSSS